MSSTPPAAEPAAATAAAASAADEVLVLTPKGSRDRRPSSAIRSHDFRQSGFLAPSELRRIRLRHEQFVRSLAARLAIFLRLEFTVQLAKVQIVGYQEFTDGLSSPTHITLFRTDPLKGVGLLVIPPRIGLGMVDRLLGGPGQLPDAARDLSEIEIALTDQIVMLLLNEWCVHWPEMRDLRPVLLGHENNSRFLQTAPPDTAMLVLTLEAGISGQGEFLQLVFPYATFEPLVHLLSPPLAEPEPAPARTGKVVWNPEFDELTVNTGAQWHGLKISAGEISRLKPGNVLMLAPGCAGQVQLHLGQTPKFLGRPGVCGNKWAVQITEVLAD
jgi:flagellar motor switch protein FliM